MPPGDEYSAAGGGGKLKLKGNKVSEGRVEKKKAKKAKRMEEDAPGAGREVIPKEGEGDGEGGGSSADALGNHPADAATATVNEGDRKRSDDGTVVVGKTETERKYEETRRKRVCLALLPFLSCHLYINT